MEVEGGGSTSDWPSVLSFSAYCRCICHDRSLMSVALPWYLVGNRIFGASSQLREGRLVVTTREPKLVWQYRELTAHQSEKRMLHG